MDPRDRTRELLKADVDEAFRYAQGIKDDWYRCQSLANVARYRSSKSSFVQTTELALKAAKQLPNPNRIVSCSSWVVKAMAERPDVDPSETVDEMLKIIASEDNPVRQADALLLLFNAVYSRPAIRYKVLDVLLRACEKMKSWKQQRILSDIALVLAKDDVPRARQVVERITKPATKGKTIKLIEDGSCLGPNEFFPYYTKTPEAHPVR
jgi:hypothetical protein